MSQLSFSAPRCVASTKAVLGEGPIWEPNSHRLFWLDIKGKSLFAYSPSDECTVTLETPAMVSALGLATGADFVCARNDGFFLLDLRGDTLSFHKIADPEEGLPGNRFNDGKVDPSGAFWAGTMDDTEGEASGSWWKLDPDGIAVKILGGFHVTNGPAFDPDRDRVYVTDSAKQVIYILSGQSADNPRPFLTFEKGAGYPDGMEVDREGRLWVAFWDGGCIRCFSPEGDELYQVDLPVTRPTSLTIVDDVIYVTSASIGLSASLRERTPDAGGLFKVTASEPIGVERRFRFDATGISNP